jgi:hypothetical protein
MEDQNIIYKVRSQLEQKRAPELAQRPFKISAPQLGPTGFARKGHDLRDVGALALAIALAFSTVAPSDPPVGTGGDDVQTSSDPPPIGGGG